MVYYCPKCDATKTKLYDVRAQSKNKPPRTAAATIPKLPTTLPAPLVVLFAPAALPVPLPELALTPAFPDPVAVAAAVVLALAPTLALGSPV